MKVDVRPLSSNDDDRQSSVEKEACAMQTTVEERREKERERAGDVMIEVGRPHTSESKQ